MPGTKSNYNDATHPIQQLKRSLIAILALAVFFTVLSGDVFANDAQVSGQLNDKQVVQADQKVDESKSLIVTKSKNKRCVCRSCDWESCCGNENTARCANACTNHEYYVRADENCNNPFPCCK